VSSGPIELADEGGAVRFKGRATSGLGGGISQTPVVHLTSAQILALDSVPVVIVPQKAGVLVPLWLFATIHQGGTAYVISGDGIVCSTASIGASLLLPALNSELLLTGQEALTVDGTYNGGPTFAASPVSGALGPITLSADDIIEDGDGTVDLICVYMEVPLP
jgi:hypothetical protein